MLQGTTEYDRKCYKYLLEEKRNKLLDQENRPTLKLLLESIYTNKCDQASEELLKCVAVALRAEETLREGVAPAYEH